MPRVYLVLDTTAEPHPPHTHTHCCCVGNLAPVTLHTAHWHGTPMLMCTRYFMLPSFIRVLILIKEQAYHTYYCRAQRALHTYNYNSYEVVPCRRAFLADLPARPSTCLQICPSACLPACFSVCQLASQPAAALSLPDLPTTCYSCMLAQPLAGPCASLPVRPHAKLPANLPACRHDRSLPMQLQCVCVCVCVGGGSAVVSCTR